MPTWCKVIIGMIGAWIGLQILAGLLIATGVVEE